MVEYEKVKCRACGEITCVFMSDWVGDMTEAQKCVECGTTAAYELDEYEAIENPPSTSTGNLFD